jgi:hypothetical protein
MCGDERKDEGVVERLTRERDEARKDALVANRALRSVLLQDTKIEELEGKVTVDQTQSIGQEFARLMYAMLQAVGAPNCLEWVVEHPTEGKFTLTLQRCNGKSPMELRNEAADRYKSIESVMIEVLANPDIFDVEDAFAGLKSHFDRYEIDWRKRWLDAKRNDSGADAVAGAADQSKPNTSPRAETSCAGADERTGEAVPVGT